MRIVNQGKFAFVAKLWWLNPIFSVLLKISQFTWKTSKEGTKVTLEKYENNESTLNIGLNRMLQSFSKFFYFNYIQYDFILETRSHICLTIFDTKYFSVLSQSQIL